MASSITQVSFRNDDYGANNTILNQSDITTDTSDPFIYSIAINSATPQIIKTIVYITPTGVPNTTSGVIYAGDFKPAISQIDAVSISGGPTLSNAEKQIILGSITPFVSDPTNGEDNISINLIDIANNGIEMFGLTIPYIEQHIVNNSPLIDIPFLQVSGSTSLHNPTTLSIDTNNGKFVIDGELDPSQTPVLQIQNTSGRNFVSATVQNSLVGSDSYFSIDWSEDIAGQDLVVITNNNPFIPFLNEDWPNSQFEIAYTYTSIITSSPRQLRIDVTQEAADINVQDGLFNSGGVYMAELYASNGMQFSFDFQSRTSLVWGYNLPSSTTSDERTGQAIKIDLDLTRVRSGHAFISLTGSGANRYFDVQLANIVNLSGVQSQSNSFTVSVSDTDLISEVIASLQDAFDSQPGFSPGMWVVSYCDAWDSLTNPVQPLPAEAELKNLYASKINNFSNSTISAGNPVFVTFTLTPTSGWVYHTFPIPYTPTSWTSGINIFKLLDAIRGKPVFKNNYFLGVTQKIDSSITPGSVNRIKALTHSDIAIVNNICNLLPVCSIEPVSIAFDSSVGPQVIYAKGVYHSVSHTFDLSNYSSMNELCTDITTTFQEFTSFFPQDVMSIRASPGTNYSYLDPSTYLPLDNFWFADRFFPAPSFSTTPNQVRLQAPLNSIIYSSVNRQSTVAGETIAQLASFLNSSLTGTFTATIESLTNSTRPWTDILLTPILDISLNNSSQLFDVLTPTPYHTEYSLSDYTSLDVLVSDISNDWEQYGLTVSIDSGTNGQSAVPANLNNAVPLSIYGTSRTLYGKVQSIITPSIPEYTIQLNFDITLSTGPGPGNGGIQVAYGGYLKDGTEVLSEAPNTFQEPGFNVFFPIEYTVQNADKVYLLLRTRTDDTGTSFLSRAQDYSASATYQNGSATQSLPPVIETEDPFLTAWLENNIGDPPADQVPIALIVPLSGPRVDVHISDTRIGESVSVIIKNSLVGLDEFGFLAINRTNRSGSMKESRQGSVFGLVLDNRGAWDILIGPEAILEEVSLAGNFSYLAEQYSRRLISNDEAYDFALLNPNSLPNSVRNGVSFLPVPGYPQVWVMRIENAVKDYLLSQRVGVPKNSNQGCSTDIDFSATGRTTGAFGIGRITLFADVYCVFDINLCDTFWNLKDPVPDSHGPNGGPPIPEIIENRLAFTYESLLNCNQIDLPSTDGNAVIKVPILTHIENVPIFKNGVAVLLLKSSYTAEVQSYYAVTPTDFQSIDFQNCTPITGNSTLVYSLNRAALYLRGQPIPITDPLEIQSKLASESSYMYVQPSYHFPTNDLTTDCSVSEIVIMSVGYEFKNWDNGFRHEDVVFGVEMHIGSDTFVLPQLTFCSRYYYNQSEG